jgi:hypothetical protein
MAALETCPETLITFRFNLRAQALDIFTAHLFAVLIMIYYLSFDRDAIHTSCLLNH